MNTINKCIISIIIISILSVSIIPVFGIEENSGIPEKTEVKVADTPITAIYTGCVNEQKGIMYNIKEGDKPLDKCNKGDSIIRTDNKSVIPSSVIVFQASLHVVLG